MIEKLKSALLTILVALSLVQSYLLINNYPEIGATVRTEQEYISPEEMGDPLRIDEVLYPEDIVVHMGGDRHSVLYPETTYYIRIYDQVTSGEYRGFQRINAALRDWDELRRHTQGFELRFGGAVPVALLQKTMQLDGDILFLNDSIERIWAMRRNYPGRTMAEIYFFSSDGRTAYLASRSSLTVDDITDITVGVGGYMPSYTLWRGDIYLPAEPLEAIAYSFGYTAFTPQQMQRSLFFNPNKTRYLEDRSGQVIYTDGKRGLQLESGDTWMVFTDPVPMQDGAENLTDNVTAAVQFVNQHGGWDGRYRFMPGAVSEGGRNIAFQQYYGQYPLIGGNVRYGQIRLLMQQGTAVVYERSLLNLGERQRNSEIRWLPGGARLRSALETYARLRDIEAVFPALYVTLTEERTLVMEPVWAVRLADGTIQSVMKAADRRTPSSPSHGEMQSAEPSSGSGDAPPEEGAGPDESSADQPSDPAVSEGHAEGAASWDGQDESPEAGGGQAEGGEGTAEDTPDGGEGTNPEDGAAEAGDGRPGDGEAPQDDAGPGEEAAA